MFQIPWLDFRHANERIFNSISVIEQLHDWKKITHGVNGNNTWILLYEKAWIEILGSGHAKQRPKHVSLWIRRIDVLSTDVFGKKQNRFAENNHDKWIIKRKPKL